METESVEDLKDWERRLYQPGGSSARVSFVAFGHFKHPMEISMRSYHTSGVPDFVDVTMHMRSQEPELFKASLHGYAADWLKANDTTQYSTVRMCEQMIRIEGKIPDPKNLNYLRDVIGILAALMDNHGVAVLDRTSQRWWRPAEWKNDVWTSHEFDVFALINSVVGRDSAGSSWTVTTRGMLKFGRPDVSVRKFPKPQTAIAVEVANRMASALASGAVVPDGKVMKTPLVQGDLICCLGETAGEADVKNSLICIDFPAR